jgi:hypothetical protein
MLKYNLSNVLERKYFISFYKVRNWSIFVKKNVMYMCIQNKNIFQKTFKWFLVFMKIESILYHISIYIINIHVDPLI